MEFAARRDVPCTNIYAMALKRSEPLLEKRHIRPLGTILRMPGKGASHVKKLTASVRKQDELGEDPAMLSGLCLSVIGELRRARRMGRHAYGRVSIISRDRNEGFRPHTLETSHQGPSTTVV